MIYFAWKSIDYIGWIFNSILKLNINECYNNITLTTILHIASIYSFLEYINNSAAEAFHVNSRYSSTSLIELKEQELHRINI